MARSRLTVVLAAALAGVIAHGGARFADKAAMYLRSPYSRDPGEGAVLAMVQLLEERGNYFLDMRDYPFAHLNYPPVFPALAWPFFHVLGPSLFVPRLLSTLATLAIVAVVFALVIVEGLLEQVPGLGDCLAVHYREAEDLPPYRLLRPDPAVSPVAAP